MKGRLIVPLVALMLTIPGCSGKVERRTISVDQQRLVDRMRAAGATDIDANGRADGGMSVAGKLEGRAFGVAVPARWNGQAVLFANGYSTPGTPVLVPADPVAKEPSGGYLTAAYKDGFAVGQSAFDKPAMAVKSGVANTLRLREWFRRLGTQRFYLGGASMGGNIVMALIEKHPDAFAGAMAACGVTGDWETEIGALVDLRASYDYFTRGTAYALPGDKVLGANGVSPVPPAGLGVTRPLWLMWQIRRMSSPIGKLFKESRRNPGGPEAKMVARIASVADADPDPGSFMFAIMTAMVGMDDMRASFGGIVYGNRQKIYHSDLLTDAENAALNRGIGRTDADPRAVAFADQWYRSTGRFRTPLITVHNEHDGLVFAEQGRLLASRVKHQGNEERLIQLWAPSQQKEIPGTGLKGWAHCGFTPQEGPRLWQALHQWVETGKRPDMGA
ncbi:MAG: prolyl oligopeptidase family serine peptidase [Sphingobium yanoikuyae]|nr:prolyl oligopeptidase family serine peptidase [Sphingobium yanoikuyae]